MDHPLVTSLVIKAFAAHDDLAELLVLKGGNALSVHHIGERASLDVDYSIDSDIQDLLLLKSQVEAALSAEFSRHQFVVFDVKITPKPKLHGEDLRPTWGGWAVEFKLLSQELWRKLDKRPEKRAQQALDLGGNKKAFQIDISKFEFVGGAVTVDYEGYELRVYSPAMIVFEKLRALCQQLPEYEPVAHPSPRPRDFVDICAVLEEEEQEEQVLAKPELLHKVFGAKEVPLSWLHRISTQQQFHEKGWVSVVQQLPHAKPFLFYFERVQAFIERLEILGVVDAPPV